MTKRRAPGEGTIYFWEEKNLWVAQISFPNGKRRKKYGKTQKEVKAWLLASREAIRDQNWIEEDKITLTEFLDRYLTDVAQHTLKPKTIEVYEYLIRLHIKPELGELRLTALRPDHLQNLYSQKLKTGLSKRTVQFIHSVLHKVLDQALRWGLVLRNVADLVDPPSVKKRSLTIWTVEQSKTFLQQVASSRFKPMYYLAFVGLREGEILGVHIEDFNKDDHTLKIDHTIQYLVGKGLVLNEPKTDKSNRTLKLPDFVYNALVDHCEKLNRKTGLMFTTGNSTPFSPRNFFRDFKEQTVAAELPEIKFHDLRHTAISYLTKIGVPPAVVQGIVGHSSALLALDVYTHTTPQMQDEAMEKMSELFK